MKIRAVLRHVAPGLRLAERQVVATRMVAVDGELGVVPVDERVVEADA